MALFDRKKEESKTEEASPEGQVLETLKAIQEGQTKMTEALAGMNTANTRSFAALAASLKPSEESPKNPEPVTPTDEEFEGMSNKDLFDKIVGRVEEVVSTHLEGAMKGVGERVQRTEVSAQIDKARQKFEDFEEWRGEMKAEYDRLGGKVDNIEDLYHLAKARNPEKVSQLAKAAEEAEQAKKVEEAEAEDEKVIDMKSLFGGMPSSGNQEAGEDSSSSSGKTKDVAASVVDKAFGNPAVRHLLSGDEAIEA